MKNMTFGYSNGIKVLDKRMTYQRLIKITAIFGFLLLLVAISQILDIPSATSFDASIYDAFPIGFWLCLMAALFMGQLAILIAVLSKEPGNTWVVGFLGVVFANTLLLSIPLIRGYFIYGAADVATHVGYIKDILVTGNINASDFYPLLHVFGSSISVVTEISISLQVILLPILYSLFFIFTFHLLAKRVFLNQGEILLATMFSSILIFGGIHFLYTPYSQSFLLIPLLLYPLILINRPPLQTHFKVLLIIVLVLLAFYHPLSSIVVTGILLIFFFCLKLVSRESRFIARSSELKITKALILISITVFTLWSAYTYALVDKIVEVFKYILGEGPSSDLGFYSALLTYANPDIVDLIILFLNIYGQVAILSILSIFVIVYVLHIRNKKEGKDLNIYILVSITAFLSFLIQGIMLFFLPFQFIFIRMIYVAILFSILLIPYALYRLLSSPKRITSSVVTTLFCLSIIGLLYFSTLNVFPSPRIKEVSNQVMLASYVGMDAYFNLCDDDLPVWEIGPYKDRYIGLLYGMNAKNDYIFRYSDHFDHFGYLENGTVSSSFLQDIYIYIDESGRVFYPTIYPEFPDKWRLTPTDFYRLKVIDPGSNLIYNNGIFHNYFISSGTV